MQTVIFTLHWRLCPLKKINYENTIPKQLRNIKLSQQSFCEKYKIPYLSIIPNYGPVVDLELTSQEIKIWQAKSQILSYDFGINFLIITFQSKLEKPNFRIFSKIKRIDRDGLFGYAVHIKKSMCKTYRDEVTNSLCEFCNDDKVIPPDTIIISDQEDPITIGLKNQITQTEPHEKIISPFNLYNSKWYVHRNHQLISYNKTNPFSINELKSSLVWASTFIKGVKRYGNKIITDKVKKLPPYFDYSKKELSDNIDKYIASFFYRFIISDSQFLINKEDVGLNIRNEELKLLTHLYRSKTSQNFWKITDESIKKFISSSLVSFLKLYQMLRKTPFLKTIEWCERINPKSYHTLPNTKIYSINISRATAQLCFEMAKHLVSQKPKATTSNMIQETINYSFTRSKMIDIFYDGIRGEKIYERLNTKLKTLKENKFIFEDNTKKNPRYYLNPTSPFTEYLIQLNQLDFTFDEFTELNEHDLLD